MTITLPGTVGSVLAHRAKQRGMTPDALATDLLQQLFAQMNIADHEEWAQRIRAIGVDTGYEVTDSAARDRALSSEGLYD